MHFIFFCYFLCICASIWITNGKVGELKMKKFEGPEPKYIDIPIHNPNGNRGAYVKYGYRIYGDNVTDGGNVLFMMNGWSGTQYEWFNLCNKLATCMTVVTVDHRGIGKSEILYKNGDRYVGNRKHIPLFSLEDLADDLYQLILYLFKCKRNIRINLLGLSMGGMIAQIFTIKYPQIISNLILVATTPGILVYII